MRKWSLLAILGLGLSVVAAGAQKKPGPGKPGGDAKVVTPTGTVKVTGPVKGAPTGSTFVIATPRKGPVSVDATGATVRHHGKFASLGDLKSGAFVQASGTMTGSTLKASQVNILRLPGDKSAKKGPVSEKGGPPAARPASSVRAPSPKKP